VRVAYQAQHTKATCSLMLANVGAKLTAAMSLLSLLSSSKQAALGLSNTCRGGTYARLLRQYERRTMASLASAYSSAVVTLWVTRASRSRAPSDVLPPAPPPEPFVAAPGTPAGVLQADVNQLRAEPSSKCFFRYRLQNAFKQPSFLVRRICHNCKSYSLIGDGMPLLTPTAHTQAWVGTLRAPCY